MTLDDARGILHEWVANPALRHHMECVAACMGAYADVAAPAERASWMLAGLLHDLDWERHPTAEEHPRVGVAFLRTKGVGEDVLHAIMAHAPYTGTPRDTPMARHLFAVDELAGFIVACGKVRPDGVATLEPASVRKKLKNLAFAAAVSRDDIATGIAELGVDADAHIQRCIDAIRGLRDGQACG
ncbi:MAG: HD domain-containing protein [Phycisphaerales bacterium]